MAFSGKATYDNMDAVYTDVTPDRLAVRCAEMAQAWAAAGAP